MKTLEPDIYDIYETENANDKSIGIALVQTMNDSKICNYGIAYGK